MSEPMTVTVMDDETGVKATVTLSPEHEVILPFGKVVVPPLGDEVVRVWVWAGNVVYCMRERFHTEWKLSYILITDPREARRFRLNIQGGMTVQQSESV